jgi:DNA-binding CsgD family transcriptional regulator
VKGFRDRLDAARRPRDVGQAVHDQVRDGVGHSGFGFLPLAEGGQDLSEVVQASDEVPPEQILQRLFETLPTAERELGTVEGFLQSGRRTVDFHEALGTRRVERLETYREFWRPCGIERQLVHFMGTPQQPLGLVCVARRARDRPFSSADARMLERVGTAADRALRRLRRPVEGPGDVQALLGALEAGLPIACALFDTGGRLVWLSRAALVRFDTDAPRLGRARILSGRCAEFESWRRAAMAAAREPEADGGEPRLRVEAPGGTRPVSVRRLFPAHGRPLVLVSALEPSGLRPPAARPEDLRRFRLTDREAQVAVLAARGFAVLNVAAELGIAETTVRSHVKSLYRKMQVANRAELTARVLGAVLGIAEPAGGGRGTP